MADLLTIGEVSRRSGVASSALRFYEERGLIASERDGSGHRRFPRAVLRRIAFIVFAQRVGLTPRRDRRRARQAAARPRPQPPRLVAPLEQVDGADRRADRRARAAQGRAHRLHRLRLSVARPLPARQPRRPRRRASGRGRATGSATSPSPRALRPRAGSEPGRPEALGADARGIEPGVEQQLAADSTKPFEPQMKAVRAAGAGRGDQLGVDAARCARSSPPAPRACR